MEVIVLSSGVYSGIPKPLSDLLPALKGEGSNELTPRHWQGGLRAHNLLPLLVSAQPAGPVLGPLPLPQSGSRLWFKGHPPKFLRPRQVAWIMDALRRRLSKRIGSNETLSKRVCSRWPLRGLTMLAKLKKVTRALPSRTLLFCSMALWHLCPTWQ